MSLALAMYVCMYVIELLPNLALLRSERLVTLDLTVVPRNTYKMDVLYMYYSVNRYQYPNFPTNRKVGF